MNASRHLRQQRDTLDGNFHCTKSTKNIDPTSASLYEGTGFFPTAAQLKAHLKRAPLPKKKEVRWKVESQPTVLAERCTVEPELQLYESGEEPGQEEMEKHGDYRHCERPMQPCFHQSFRRFAVRRTVGGKVSIRGGSLITDTGTPMSTSHWPSQSARNWNGVSHGR